MDCVYLSMHFCLKHLKKYMLTHHYICCWSGPSLNLNRKQERKKMRENQYLDGYKWKAYSGILFFPECSDVPLVHPFILIIITIIIIINFFFLSLSLLFILSSFFYLFLLSALPSHSFPRNQASLTSLTSLFKSTLVYTNIDAFPHPLSSHFSHSLCAWVTTEFAFCAWFRFHQLKPRFLLTNITLILFGYHHFAPR